MTLERVTKAVPIKRISQVAIAVRDLERQADFYINMCGLQPVERASHHLYLRASGGHHHVFELLKGRGGLDHVSFQLDDEEDIQRCADILERETPSSSFWAWRSFAPVMKPRPSSR